MRIISFGWTAIALLTGNKTVTRREWTESYAESFYKGEYLQAYEKSLRYVGKHIATIQLTNNPYKEWSANCSDWHAEGFQFLTEHNIKSNGHSPKEILADWQTNPRMLWVVRFQLLNITEAGKSILRNFKKEK